MKSLAYLSAAVALATATPSYGACVFGKVAELPVTMRGLRPTITTKINDQEAKFIVDSGAFYSMVSEEAAARLGMKPSMAPSGLRLQGVGGHSAAAKVARAQTFGFAQATFKNVEFLVAPRAGEGEMVGLLGQNILGTFDIEYDLANGVLRFFKAEDCDKANLAYWSAGKTLSRLPLKGADGGQVMKVLATAKIDGHEINVEFDSGASVSVLSKPAAARAGVKPTSDNVASGGLSYGIFGGGIETYLAPFGSFAIGDEEIRNTQLRVADIEVPQADMLLGADFFLSHRILVSRSQKKIYFTYNGGPVFRLDQARKADAGPAPAADATPVSAAEHSRRGAALAARRDFPAAVASFTKAIEQEPNEPAHFKARAMARFGAGQHAEARADMERALKLKPHDADLLVARGGLYLAEGDETRARTEFDAAFKASTNPRQTSYLIGSAYSGAGRFAAAVGEFDRWLATWPKDEFAAQILNERCWARALWNRDLPVALADCDAAIKRGGKTSSFQDSRGLVLLRMGRLDDAIAQYDAAIRLQPRSAWSLYGRGLAKIRKGDRAGGEADIAAARAVQPDLVEEAKRYGLAVDATAAVAAKS